MIPALKPEPRYETLGRFGLRKMIVDDLVGVCSGSIQNIPCKYKDVTLLSEDGVGYSNLYSVQSPDGKYGLAGDMRVYQNEIIPTEYLTPFVFDSEKDMIILSVSKEYKVVLFELRLCGDCFEAVDLNKEKRIGEIVRKTEIKRGEPFYINGEEYPSKKELYRECEYINCPERHYSFHKHKNGTFILSFFEMYPCFDSYDYANEDRFYTALFFCSSLEEAEEKCHFLSSRKRNVKRVEELTGDWIYLCPFVYMDDGKEMFRTYELL
jgi:hypothetical protein